MKKAAVVGVYGVGADFTTGQAVKCYEIINWLKKKYGQDEIEVVNTYKWKKNPLKLLVDLLNAFRRCKNIIIMPAQHGIKVFAPLAYYFGKIFKRKIHYVVIGGWLAEMLTEQPRMKKYICSFDAVHVETQEMVSQLKEIGLEQVYHMPNFRILPDRPPERQKHWQTPIPVCTYSRVVKEKGILDAIEIVKEANRYAEKNIFRLDVYGKVASEFKEEFEKAIVQNNAIMRYCGVKNANEGVDVLCKYFALLFPTYYEGEGVAGTLLDAMAAGTPPIVNEWKYNREVVVDGVNGFIYPYRNIEVAARCLCELERKNELYENMVRACLERAKYYSTDRIMHQFVTSLE